MKQLGLFLFVLLNTANLQVTNSGCKKPSFSRFSIWLAIKSLFLKMQKTASYLVSKNLKTLLSVRTAGERHINNLTNGITPKESVTNGIIVSSCCHAGQRVHNSNVISAFTVRTVFNLAKRFLHVETKKLKQVSLWLLFGIGLSELRVGCWTLNTAFAKDFGIHGHTFEIQEPDLLKEMEGKLRQLEADGKLTEINKSFLKRTENSLTHPKAVEGITKAIEPREFFYDPSITVPYDLKDHEGRVFHKAGTRINPLESRSLPAPLIFIDGSDEAQVAWIENLYLKTSLKKQTYPKIILTSGSPFELMNQWQDNPEQAELDQQIEFEQRYSDQDTSKQDNTTKAQLSQDNFGQAHPLYFDQGGRLTEKFGIRHVPAVVVQDGLKLKISEIVIDEQIIEVNKP